MEEAKNLEEADLVLDQDLKGRAMAVTHRGRRDQVMEVEEGQGLKDGLRDDLKDDLRDPVLTMEAKEDRHRVVGRCLDLQVFSTCFPLLTWQLRPHR